MLFLAPSILSLDRGLETPDFRNQRMVIERVQTGGDIKNVFASIWPSESIKSISEINYRKTAPLTH